MQRFKIDLAGSGYPFGIYFRKERWHYFITGGTRWEKHDSFETYVEAKDHYETIKDLPEYLD